MKTIWYSSSDEEDPVRISLAIDIMWSISRPREQAEIAVSAAHHYYSFHKTSATWPRDITLYETKDGPPIASFKVHLDMEPDFYAYPKKGTA